MTVKLGDVGLARLAPELAASMAQSHVKDSVPVGTIQYIDPEYMRTGQLSPLSDVYSLGITLLQLLTALSPSGVVEAVENALENDNLSAVLDKKVRANNSTACVRLLALWRRQWAVDGLILSQTPHSKTCLPQADWPLDVAESLARLALNAAEMKRRKRPDLEVLSNTLLFIRFVFRRSVCLETVVRPRVSSLDGQLSSCPAASQSVGLRPSAQVGILPVLRDLRASVISELLERILQRVADGTSGNSPPVYFVCPISQVSCCCPLSAVLGASDASAPVLEADPSQSVALPTTITGIHIPQPVVRSTDDVGCPQELMSDPVVARDGFAYERASLVRWLEETDVSPMTNTRLEDSTMEPAPVLIAAINRWQAIVSSRA